MAKPRKARHSQISTVIHLLKKMLGACQWSLVSPVATMDSLLMVPYIGTLLQDSIYWIRASDWLSLGHVSVPSLLGSSKKGALMLG